LLFEIVVVVPGLKVAAPELNETHAPLQKSARDEELTADRPLTVQVADGCRLAVDVEGVGRLALHPVRQLKGLETGFELGVALPLVEVLLIQSADQVELAALFGWRGAGVLDVLDELLKVGLRGVDVGALVSPRQEGRAPVLGCDNGVAAGTHGDEARQILVF